VKKNRIVIVIVVLVGMLYNVSCTVNSTYDRSVAIPKYRWDYNFVPSFPFTVEDTTAFYSIYISTRHLEEYAYSNMWIWVHLQQPDGKVTHQRVQLQLAQADGKWNGEGLNGIWLCSLPYKQFITFKSKGEYLISLEQNMRINPLPAVMNMGVKVIRTERSKTQKKAA